MLFILSYFNLFFELFHFRSLLLLCVNTALHCSKYFWVLDFEFSLFRQQKETVKLVCRKDLLRFS